MIVDPTTSLEPAEGVVVVSASEAEDSKVVDEFSSYREDNNFLSNLKEFESKALNELKARLEESILGGTLLKKVDEAAVDEEEKVQEPTKEEKHVEVDIKVSIWGVPLFPSKAHEGTEVVLLKFLRAREFKVGDAFEMLVKTLRWRKDWIVESVDEGIASELSSAGYLSTVDCEGNPICYDVYGAFATDGIYQVNDLRNSS